MGKFWSYLKTSFGHSKTVVYTACDEWEIFSHIKASFRRRKIVVDSDMRRVGKFWSYNDVI